VISTLSPEAALRFADLWIDKHIDFYDPLAWRTTEERYLRRKAFAELSTYLAFKAWCGFPAPVKLHRFVVDVANSAEFLGLLCNRPSEFLLFAPAILYPVQADCLASSTRRALLEIAAEPAVRSTERFPHRQLEYAFCCETTLGEPGGDQLRSVYDLSILAHRLFAGFISIEDAYALTHSVFYATRFGSDMGLFHERPELLPNVEDIDAMICRYTFEQNLDVALELAATRMIVSDKNSPATALCIDKAVNSLSTMGHVPRPPGAEVEKRDTLTEEFLEWSEQYHSMLVLGFTLAFALGHEIELPGEPPNAEQLSRYGALLSATFNADIYETCVRTAEFLASGTQGLPGAQFQISAVERMLRRHIELVDVDGDPGLLIDALRLGELSSAIDTRAGIENVNRLARLILPKLKRFSGAAAD